MSVTRITTCDRFGVQWCCSTCPKFWRVSGGCVCRETQMPTSEEGAICVPWCREAAADATRLSRLQTHGNGIGIIHDDNGKWGVGSDGFQSIRTKEDPADLETRFYIESHCFRKGIRDAIDYFFFMEEGEDLALNGGVHTETK